MQRLEKAADFRSRCCGDTQSTRGRTGGCAASKKEGLRADTGKDCTDVCVRGRARACLRGRACARALALRAQHQDRGADGGAGDARGRRPLCKGHRLFAGARGSRFEWQARIASSVRGRAHPCAWYFEMRRLQIFANTVIYSSSHTLLSTRALTHAHIHTFGSLFLCWISLTTAFASPA